MHLGFILEHGNNAVPSPPVLSTSLPPSALPGTFPEWPHRPPHNLLQPPATTTNKFYATAAPVTAGGGSQVKSIERLRGVRHPKSQEGGREWRGTCKDATLGFQGFSLFFSPAATTVLLPHPHADSLLNLTPRRIYTSH